MNQPYPPTQSSGALRHISVRGARIHNLKNINVDIPHHKMVVITGLSGSGKSSLAFDTIYAEGQRRYVESLSAYARQFLSLMEKPDVDYISGLSPAISIDQKSASHNPRSTVGTITEIYDYLRLLFARAGQPHCPVHGEPLHAQSVDSIVKRILALESGRQLAILAPIIRERKGEHIQLLDGLLSQGFIRVRIDGTIYVQEDVPVLDPNRKHTIEAIVDRFRVRSEIQSRLSESIETALRLSSGLVRVIDLESNAKELDLIFSNKHACTQCGFSLPELEPRLFSFNSPFGACSNCNGIGTLDFFDPDLVVVDPSMSLSDGAIFGWSTHSPYYFELLLSVAKHYGFSTSTPFDQLSEKHKKIILYGSGKEKIVFSSVGNARSFEGVLGNMERRYRETDIRSVRETLHAYKAISICPKCQGSRLNESASNVFFQEKNIAEVTSLSVDEALDFFEQIKLSGSAKIIADRIVLEIINRLRFLSNVGLGYLTLARSANTLSGGEAQRIRLASQVGAGLVGVMYVLDEPSIGLHQRDNQRLLDTLFHLRNIGNTVIVVEHDEDTIRQADFILDIGPKAGELGGEVVAQGSVEDLCQTPESITGQYMSGKRKISVPKKRTKFDKKKVLKIVNANGNNLKDITVSLPVGLLTCVTGVSGSGKSTLINRTLFPIAQLKLNRAFATSATVMCDKIEGLEQFDKVINIDQSPIGRTPRSNPATYVGVFTHIRELFSNTKQARARGFKAGRFSFNVRGGRCESCQGDGIVRVEMHFLPDVFVPCDHCRGRRYNEETLSIEYKGKNIADILDMTIDQASDFFESIPMIYRKIRILKEIGLSYIKLGQSATTLSGGEAQRIKLSKELSRRSNDRSLYIFDEPTTGLHFYDIELLLKMIMLLRDQGSTIVVIEHNLDVVKSADWIIDLGPEGGDAGGYIITQGTPNQVALCQKSHTGQFLKKYLVD